MITLPGGSLFSPPKPPAPPVLQPLPPLPTGPSAEETARKEEERLARKRRSGLGATQLTSPNLGDANDANVDRSTLGGS